MCASAVGEYNSVHNEIITVSCERSAGSVRRFSLRENYSLLRQASSMVTTRCDAENLLFLHRIAIVMKFIYISAFFIRKRKQPRRSWRNYTMSTLRTAAQGSQYTVDYVYSVNSISIVRGPRSCFRPYPKFGE